MIEPRVIILEEVERTFLRRTTTDQVGLGGQLKDKFDFGGQIGRCVIDILSGFGCRVLAFDKYPSPEVAARPNVLYADLDRLPW